MQVRTSFVLSFLSIAFLITCGNTDEFSQAYSIEKINEADIIQNYAPQWGSEPKLMLEFLHKIGGLGELDENYAFYAPKDVDFDVEGNMYVFDAANYRIQKFNPLGDYVATFGNKGDGPAEFRQPMYFDLDYKGHIFVGDFWRGGQFIELDSDGKEVRRLRTGDRGPTPGRFGRSGNFYTPAYGDSFLVHIYNNDGDRINAFGDVKKFNVEYLDKYGMGNKLILTIDDNENIFVTFEYQNRIEKYSRDGTLLFKTDRPMNFDETVDEKYEMRDPGPPRNAFNGAFLDDPRFPTGEREMRITNKFSNSIAVDGFGRIWVVSNSKQIVDYRFPGDDSLVFHVFDVKGIFLGEIPLPVTYQHADNAIRIFDDRLFIIDAFDNMCLYEYKIVEK